MKQMRQWRIFLYCTLCKSSFQSKGSVCQRHNLRKQRDLCLQHTYQMRIQCTQRLRHPSTCPWHMKYIATDRQMRNRLLYTKYRSLIPRLLLTLPSTPHMTMHRSMARFHYRMGSMREHPQQLQNNQQRSLCKTQL